MLSTDQEYKDQIKNVGEYNLKDTHKWKERAIFFQEKGYYTEAIEDTHDWVTFWQEEKEKILNGLWIDGFYIPGLYYFYLNYLPIYHKQLNKYEFPDVYDMDYHTFLCLEHAIFLKKHFVVIKKRAAGYEQPYSEPVLTVDGWKTMGDLKIGDYVQTPTGIPAKILEIFEQGEKDVYEITLRDGRKVRCGLDHLWKVNEKTRRNKSVIVSLKEMLQKGIYLKSEIKGNKKKYNIYRYSIDEIDPIPFFKKELKIHPYIMGALIGDGSFSKSQVRITSADPEIHERIIKLLGDNYFYGSDKDQCTKNKKCIRFSIRYKKRFQELEKDFKNAKYGVNPLIRSIQDYGLIDKNTYTKFIPDDYLHSSIEDRLELLKGLMDTDGSIRESGNGVIYFTVNKILSKQVAYLVRSLGMTASISEFKGRCVNCKNFYRVKITPNKFEIFHLKRKLDRLNLNKKRFTSVAITGIKKLDYQENSRCIYIDSEDHMYLTKDFIQTHNTLKFCVPLIRELWFSRGSPCYIATYEEAQVLKTWTDVIEPYREHLNTHTAWYREFTPSKPLNWRAAKQLTTDTGRSIVKGRLNTLKGLILSKSPSKGVGGSSTFIFADEAGVNPVLSKFIGYVKPMITYGDVSTGTIIVSGAVGELKHLEGGLKDYIQYPEKNGFYAVDNIWDKDNEFSGKKCGFFVPESWSYFGIDRDPTSEFYGQPFFDEDGNSFVERAEEYIKKKRAGLIDEGEEADKFDISQKPLTLAECFQYRGDNVFSTDLINPQIAKIEKNEDHGTFVDLYRTQDKVVKHKLLSKYDNKPILEHPIDPKRKDKDGVIQVWEFPPPNRQTYGVYWAGVDIVRDSESVNSPSLNVIHIYKGSHNLSEEYTEDRIVAKFMSRPKDKMDWYQKAMLLLEWYNAEALVENNVNWFIEESIKIKEQFRLAKAPQWSKDLTPQGTAHLTKPYGVVMTPKLHEKIIDAISAYIKEPIYTTYDENTGEPTVHYGIERIRDLQLLRELVNYRPKKEYEKGNYDSICSFGLALLHAKNNEVLGIIPEDTKENVNFNQKNAKLMLRSRFSHTNLKKLSNANNI